MTATATAAQRGRAAARTDPERELILALVGVEAARARARARALELARSVDYDRLDELLARQRLSGLVGRRLEEIAPGVAPERFRRVVEERIGASRRRAALFADATMRICAGLERRGIPAVPVKGVLLAERIYGDPGVRGPSSDIDLLVRSPDFWPAAKALTELGYGEFSDVVWAHDLPHYHSPFLPRDPFLPLLELHWRVHWYEGRFASDAVARGWVGDDGARRMTPLDELTTLMLIYARDGFLGLRFAADIAAWWDRYGHLLEPLALERQVADYPRLRAVLEVGVVVLAKTVGLPPDRLMSAGPGSRRARAAVRLANWSGHGTEAEMITDVKLIDLLLSPRPALRTYVRHYFLQPTEHYRRVYGWSISTPRRNRLRRLLHAGGRALRAPASFAGRLREQRRTLSATDEQ